MARSLSSGNNLSAAAGVVTAMPLSMACWFNPTSAATAGILMCQDEAVSGDAYTIRKQAAGTLSCQSIAGGAAATATTSTSYTAGAWHHACAVFTSATSRTIYLNGGGVGTNATSKSPAAPTKTNLGFLTGPSVIYAGDLAVPAIWNAALTAADAAQLFSGASPLLIRPDVLVAYWPLIGRTSPEIDLVGGFAMTVTGTPTAAPHPRIYYPRRRRQMRAVKAVAGATVGRGLLESILLDRRSLVA